MNPREKAQELVEKFYKEVAPEFEDNELAQETMHLLYDSITKKCALIVVDEIINTGSLSEELDYGCDERNLHYWQEVKQEINQL